MGSVLIFPKNSIKVNVWALKESSEGGVVMKNVFTKTALTLTIVLALTAVAGAEQLTGKIGSGSGPDWQSSWIDLTKETNFRRGEKLKMTLRGSAENVVVRLLPSGAHPSSSDGIIGDVKKMPRDGVLQIQLPEEHLNVVQISVHGGPKAWDISLGSKNGPVTLVGVERLP
jgi:hypothetical protein